MRVVGKVALHPGVRVPNHGVGNDDHEVLVVEFRHREVCLERTSVVHPLRVSDDS